VGVGKSGLEGLATRCQAARGGRAFPFAVTVFTLEAFGSWSIQRHNDKWSRFDDPASV
jgi:hypothetical protein